jgi:hypothetical protein
VVAFFKKYFAFICLQKADASDAPAASKRGRGGNPTAAPAAKGKEAPAAKTATARRGRQKAVCMARLLRGGPLHEAGGMVDSAVNRMASEV